MTTTVGSREAVREAAVRNAARIADMVRHLRGTDIRIPRSDWTVGDAAAHLAFTTLGMAMMARGLEIPYGDGTREGLAVANEVALEGFSERDGAELAQRIVEGARMVFDEAAVQPPDRVCATPMGAMPLDGLLAYLLMHQAMHGSAMATAVDAPWPFDAEDVALMWPFLEHVLPRIVAEEAAAGVTTCYELHFGDVLGFAMMFDSGRLTVAPNAARPADCILGADPQSLLLIIAKVITVEDAIKDAQLQLSGPRAELGFTLPDLLNMP